jgi:predicted transcriptional regulator
VRRAAGARKRADRAEEEAAHVLRDAIRLLTRREHLSTRDVAALLELSPSRVDQLKRDRANRSS